MHVDVVHWVTCGTFASLSCNSGSCGICSRTAVLVHWLKMVCTITHEIGHMCTVALLPGLEIDAVYLQEARILFHRGRGEEHRLTITPAHAPFQHEPLHNRTHHSVDSNNRSRPTVS